MDEVLDELVLTLAEIRARHDMAEDNEDYRETEALYYKAELCIKRLREESAKLQAERDDLHDRYMYTDGPEGGVE